MIEFIPTLLTLAALDIIATISPGPDFAVVVKNSLLYSRKTAMITVLGISFGIIVHLSYIVLGLGVIIQENEWLFLSMKWLGAGYLLYIGIKGLMAKKASLDSVVMTQRKDIPPLQAFRSGFLTNALNPKCILFFISLFSAVVPPHTPTFILLLGGLVIFINTIVWFGFVAFCLSGKKTREKFNAAGHWIERITGGILVSLGAKLLLAL